MYTSRHDRIKYDINCKATVSAFQFENKTIHMMHRLYNYAQLLKAQKLTCADLKELQYLQLLSIYSIRQNHYEFKQLFTALNQHISAIFTCRSIPSHSAVTYRFENWH